ncbi:Peptidoglycan D,D-transpeptidase MrdA [Paraconexibacter sp. AEG42_29]|uniref:Beta-lactamase n=1 Tax=Paraconexibacter sp. AEG42_29 TaxID=2997339 RepID=A0AAU7AWU1_9ACTN
MIDPVPGDRRPAVSPQLALRISAVGLVAFLLFSVLFFRLWYLQVLDGDSYRVQANSNRSRVETLPAARGSIVDRNGEPLVQNTAAVVARLRPDSLPASEKEAAADYGDKVIERAKLSKRRQGPEISIPAVPPDFAPRVQRLARTLGMRVATIQERIIRGLFLAGYAPVTIKANLPEDVAGFILERPKQFPGVETPQVLLRAYPQRSLAAQIFGTTNQISPEQLKERYYRERKVRPGTVIGRSGVEAAFDDYLRGTDGRQTLRVDAQGNPRGNGRVIEPTPGRGVQLTLDLDLQKAADAAYRRVAGNLDGAFVALDPRNGAILATGSFPTYDPTLLARPISDRRYKAIFEPKDGSAGPLLDRVSQSLYPAASTFKIVTALAGFDEGLITPSSTYADTGCIVFGGDKRRACNSGGGKGNGEINVATALKVSSDTFFYDLGLRLFEKRGEPLQKWARRLGFGRITGNDLGGETKGNVPDAAWRRRVGQIEIDCRKKNKIPLSAPSDVAGTRNCGLYDVGPFTLGEAVNLAVGQGALQTNPLQLAVAYAALANGGRIVRPHLGSKVIDDTGAVLQPIPAEKSRKIKIPAAFRSAIMDGLHRSASEPGGTSADVFSNSTPPWNQKRFPIFGKTGTAENVAQVIDQSWYVAYSYDRSPERKPIVVVVTAEKGRFGADTAAPIARLILSAWFGVKAAVVRGASETK